MSRHSMPAGKDRVRRGIIAVDAPGVVIHAVSVGHDLSIVRRGGGPAIPNVRRLGACLGLWAPAPWSEDPTLPGLPV